MGYIVIKQAPDRDEYIIWCNSFERPIAVGNRAEIAEDAQTIEPDRTDIKERLDHTDLHGSSMIPYPFAWWDHKSLIYMQRGCLPREHLAKAARLRLAGCEAEVLDLLVPFEDETEVRRG